MIQALIFDFDGLILDTEVPEYQSWQFVFDSYGCTLPFALWAAAIGSSEGFDPYQYLQQQLGRPIDVAAIQAQRRARFVELMADQQPLPGVTQYLQDAQRMGLRLAVASSSPHHWVDSYLSQYQLRQYFHAVICSDDVARTKPDPELYLTALRRLDVAAPAAIAFEDSPNGILAATRAGLYCVVVPNGLTSQLPIDHASQRLASLADLPLAQLIAQVAGRQNGVSAG